MLAIVLLLVLVTGGHALHFHTLGQSAKDAETIDLSGRQRMFSQRLLGLVQALRDVEDRERFIAAIKDSADTFLVSHEVLLKRAQNVPEALAIYRIGEAAGLDRRSRDYAETALKAAMTPPTSTEFLQLVGSMRDTAAEPLLKSLDSAVKAFARDATWHNSTNRRRQT